MLLYLCLDYLSEPYKLNPTSKTANYPKYHNDPCITSTSDPYYGLDSLWIFSVGICSIFNFFKLNYPMLQFVQVQLTFFSIWSGSISTVYGCLTCYWKKSTVHRHCLCAQHHVLYFAWPLTTVCMTTLFYNANLFFFYKRQNRVLIQIIK